MRLNILLFCLFAALLSKAQHPSLIQLTEKDGLPDIEFYTMTEDRSGFIWLGADKGLFRYDGKRFKSYTHPKKRGLSVFGLQLDRQGRVWCNNISGQYFYIENDSLHLFIDIQETVKGGLSPFYFDENGHLITSTDVAIFSINTQSGSIDTLYTNPDFFKGMPRLINMDAQRHLLMGANAIYELKGKQMIRHTLLFNSDFVAGVYSISFKVSDTYFVFASMQNFTKLLRWSEVNKKFTEFKVPTFLIGRRVIQVFENQEKQFWVTDQGLFITVLINNEFKLISHYLKDEFLTRMLMDQNGNFWFTTLRNGVYVMPNIHVRKYNLPPEFENISQVELVNDYLILGTSYGKIGILNASNLSFQSFATDNSLRVSSMVYVPEFNSLAISLDGSSGIWNLNTQQAVFYSNAFNASKELTFVPPNGLLYAGFKAAFTINQVFQKFPKTVKSSKSEIPAIKYNEEMSLENHVFHLEKRSYALHYKSYSKLTYISFIDDLRVIDSLNNSRIIRYQDQPIFATELVETVDEYLWASTYTNGLYQLQSDTVVRIYQESDGLLSNQISKMRPDGKNLWLVTAKGIQLFDRTNNQFYNLTKQSGLENYFISDIEIADSLVYISTNKGLYVIDKYYCFKPIKIPEVYFTNISVLEKDTLILPFYELPFANNSMRIQFNSNGFQSGENIRYKYRLLGLQDEWLYAEPGVDFVRYPAFPAGRFIFEIKSVDIDGRESEQLASIDILIRTPFWLQWWFYLSLLLLISLFVWWYYRQRFKQFTKEKQLILERTQLDKELVISKIENLRSQMNPHFIFNALNSIQEYIVMNEKGLASSFLVKFSRLIRIYLEQSRKNEVPLEEEVQALQLYLELEKDRFEDILEFRIELESTIDSSQIKLPPLFIQPYVENALKHGLLHKKTDRKLSIQFHFDAIDRILHCQVEDNGIGRQASLELNRNRAEYHQSFATEANARRINLLNSTRERKIEVIFYDLINEAGMGCGTRVQITIPQEFDPTKPILEKKEPLSASPKP